MSQQDLFTPAETNPREGITEADVTELRAHLMSHGWQTRREICDTLKWTERKVRDVAEAMGLEVVRCQLGFKLFDQLSREELGHAKQAADAALSQAKKMEHYGLGILRKLHTLIG